MEKLPEKSYYSISEVAKFLCITKEGVRKRIRTRNIKTIKYAHAYLIRKKDLKLVLA